MTYTTYITYIPNLKGIPTPPMQKNIWISQTEVRAFTLEITFPNWWVFRVVIHRGKKQLPVHNNKGSLPTNQLVFLKSVRSLGFSMSSILLVNGVNVSSINLSQKIIVKFEHEKTSWNHPFLDHINYISLKLNSTSKKDVVTYKILDPILKDFPIFKGNQHQPIHGIQPMARPHW